MVEPFGSVARLGGHLVHWRERAGEQPAVILMAGCGLAMEFWRDVSRLMPERRVVAYDRPGMGGTPWPGHLPTLAGEVETLRELIELTDAAPAILLAHSMAGFHAEALIREYPDVVAGLVLVDGSAEWQSQPPHHGRLLPARLVSHTVNTLRLGGAATLAYRLGTWMQSHRAYRQLGYGRIPAIYRDADSLAMATAESFAYAEQAWDLNSIRRDHPWPGVPTILLTASEGEGDGNLESQMRLAHLLHADHRVIDESKHLMMLDRPDAVADAVTEVIAEAQAVGRLH